MTTETRVPEPACLHLTQLAAVSFRNHNVHVCVENFSGTVKHKFLSFQMLDCRLLFFVNVCQDNIILTKILFCHKHQ